MEAVGASTEPSTELCTTVGLALAGGCGEVVTGGVPAGFGLRTRRGRVVAVVSGARTVRGVGRVGYENAGAVLVPAAGCRVWGSGQVRRGEASLPGVLAGLDVFLDLRLDPVQSAGVHRGRRVCVVRLIWLIGFH